MPDVGPREIEFVVLNGDPNGAIDVSWPVPSELSGGLPNQLGSGRRGISELDGFERERIPGGERLHDHGLVRGCMLQGAGAGAVWRERRRLD